MSTPHVRVAIVGSGFSGLGMAIRLSERGDSAPQDYVVFEKADEVGGTWRDNRYPGCACDVPSRLYSFSFRQNPRWSRDFATAGEIWQYLIDCADHYRVRDHIEFGADLTSAAYDETTRRWSLRLADGREWTADSLVMGVGALHRPVVPDIEGIDTFAGPTLHTAIWPDDADLAGKRVAVIGTGASAVQLVPELAQEASHLSVFQRTPAWILPKHDKVWGARRQQTFARFPALQRLVRWRTYLQLESRVLLFARIPRGMVLVEGIARRHLKASVKNPEVRARLTPTYTIGCKRILLSNEYWPTFDREDVDLVTDPIVRIEPDAVVTGDGTRHEVDALVLGTGFSLSGSYDRMRITGSGGRELAEVWSGGMHTNLGITVAGFPELYVLLGPNTALGHNSVVLMIEFATDYVLQCLDRARAGARVTTAAAQDGFTSEMASRSKHTVWTSGCQSWYLDRFGNNTSVWPGSTISYWLRTRRVRAADFEPVAAHLESAALEDRVPAPTS
ncbi:NAD(P)/FAD-dependent oxidoreductase [Lapillicoccus sp.]|uniref:flavin-containing monooxygenase n=1 Tax=Lapillicoccus sp. TaxID=1909287 RepID=UPI0025D59600|nr:NAD(P)/FAD-dependent oxidoreductase [Lapillicoccus sp.]